MAWLFFIIHRVVICYEPPFPYMLERLFREQTICKPADCTDVKKQVNMDTGMFLFQSEADELLDAFRAIHTRCAAGDSGHVHQEGLPSCYYHLQGHIVFLGAHGPMLSSSDCEFHVTGIFEHWGGRGVVGYLSNFSSYSEAFPWIEYWGPEAPVPAVALLNNANGPSGIMWWPVNEDERSRAWATLPGTFWPPRT